jgi:hypothetical protein
MNTDQQLSNPSGNNVEMTYHQFSSPFVSAPALGFYDVRRNPYIILTVLLIIILYYVLFATLGGNTINNSTQQIFEYTLWTIFIILVMLNGIAYIFDIDILHFLFADNNNTNMVMPPNKDAPQVHIPQPQVFHVSDNNYGYEEAKAICAAYDGRLAKYKELDDAYNSGADWCSYGWSDGQMALYPTQYAKWEKLQKISGHENDCGRPGINGGFIGNPDVRFGANCYGLKPAISESDAMNMQTTPLYPKTKKEHAFDKKVDYWRTQLDKLSLSPFNHDNWNAVTKK